MNAPQIDCPYCGGKMVEGIAYVRGTLMGFLASLASGFSSEHLWFRSDAGKDVIVRSGDQRAGHRCLSCGAVTVYPMTRGWRGK